MTLRKLWLLAALALGACGSPDPASDVETAADPTGNGAAAGSEVADNAEPAPATGRFRLGAHYNRLSPTQPTSSNPEQVEVAEVFWYGCPHCFAFDPLLEQWRARQPGHVSFLRVPAVWNPLLQLHARAFYTAETLGKGAEMHAELFREIHDRNNALDTEAKLQDFFARFGVDGTTFKTAFDSFEVQTKLQRADELNRRYQIGSVPTIVVNGKYTTDGPQVGSYEELLELVDVLVATEREGR